MTYGGKEMLDSFIEAYKAYQSRTGEDCCEKITELKVLRDKLIKENRIT